MDLTSTSHHLILNYVDMFYSSLLWVFILAEIEEKIRENDFQDIYTFINQFKKKIGHFISLSLYNKHRVVLFLLLVKASIQ